MDKRYPNDTPSPETCNVYVYFVKTSDKTFRGEADGWVVKVLDPQARNRGFEPRHTLGRLCLKSLPALVEV